MKSKSNREILELVFKKVLVIEGKVAGLQSDVSGLKSDVATIKREHGAMLKEHGKKLDEHDVRFTAIHAEVMQGNERMSHIDAKVDRLGARMGVVEEWK